MAKKGKRGKKIDDGLEYLVEGSKKKNNGGKKKKDYGGKGKKKKDYGGKGKKKKTPNSCGKKKGTYKFDFGGDSGGDGKGFACY